MPALRLGMAPLFSALFCRHNVQEKRPLHAHFLQIALAKIPVLFTHTNLLWVIHGQLDQRVCGVASSL
jgi:hypothetical protein